MGLSAPTHIHPSLEDVLFVCDLRLNQGFAHAVLSLSCILDLPYILKILLHIYFV